MLKEIADRFKSLKIVNPIPSLEGCPEDLRHGTIDYRRGKGISMELLEKYYNICGSITIKPSEEQIGALYSR